MFALCAVLCVCACFFHSNDQQVKLHSFCTRSKHQPHTDLFIDELAAAATRVNYGQNPADINALAGRVVSVLASRTHARAPSLAPAQGSLRVFLSVPLQG